MPLFVRQLILLLAAVGTMFPAPLLASCACEYERTSAGDQTPPCCAADQAHPAAAENTCCRCTAEEGASEPLVNCCSTGSCDCEGCHGDRPAQPLIASAADPVNAALVCVASYLPTPLPPAPAYLAASPSRTLDPPLLFAQPGVRPQAVFCVWII